MNLVSMKFKKSMGKENQPTKKEILGQHAKVKNYFLAGR